MRGVDVTGAGCADGCPLCALLCSYRDIALHDKFFLSAAKADDDAESNGDDMSRVGSFGHVFIRKRPLLQHEIQRKDWDAVTCLGRRFCVLHDGRMHANMQRKFMLHRRFKFDRVFGMNEDNETVGLTWFCLHCRGSFRRCSRA